MVRVVVAAAVAAAAAAAVVVVAVVSCCVAAAVFLRREEGRSVEAGDAQDSYARYASLEISRSSSGGSAVRWSSCVNMKRGALPPTDGQRSTRRVDIQSDVNDEQTLAALTSKTMSTTNRRSETLLDIAVNSTKFFSVGEIERRSDVRQYVIVMRGRFAT